MINLKMSKEEAEEGSPSVAGFSDKEDCYPYGLCLSLDDDTLEKLGLADPPGAGTTFTITAKVKVTSVTNRQDEGGDKESYATWQITDMETSLKPLETSSRYKNSKMK